MKWKLPWRRKHPETKVISEQEVKLREDVRKEVQETNQRMLGQLHDLEVSIVRRDSHWKEKHS